MFTDISGGYLCILFYVLRFAVGMLAIVTFLLCLQHNKRGDTFYISILALVTCILIPEDLLVLAPKEQPDFPRRALIPIPEPSEPSKYEKLRLEQKAFTREYLYQQERKRLDAAKLRQERMKDPAWQEYYRKLAAQQAAQSRSRSYRSSSSGSSSASSSDWPFDRDDDDYRDPGPQFETMMNIETGQLNVVGNGIVMPQ